MNPHDESIKKINRIKFIAGLIKQDSVVLDVGCDHAYLPIELIKSGKCGRVIACDINQKPLDIGKKNAEATGCRDNITFILSDGLNSIDCEFDTAAVCGMGGILIGSILGGAGEKLVGKRLILQPMTDDSLLRAYLWDNGYSIKNEYFITENRRPYCLMDAEYNGAVEKYEQSDIYIGKIRPKNRDFVSYCQKITRHIAKSSAKARAEDEKAFYSSLIADINAAIN